MAIRWATKTGNWSDATVWDGGTTLPTTGDEVHPATFTVTIDQDITVGSLLTTANGGAAAGGGFAVSSMTTRNITAAIGSVGANTTTVLTVSATSGTLNITGNIIGGSTNSSFILAITGAGATVNVTGNVTGPSGAGTQAGINLTGISTLNVTGTVTGGSVSNAAFGIYIQAAGIITINGSVTASGGPGLSGNNVAYILTVTGTVTAANGIPGASLSSSNATTIFYGPFVSAADGTQPLWVLRYWLKTNTTNTITQRDDSGSHVAVVFSNALTGTPAISDVRAGVQYGSGNTNTGTMRVPNPASVAFGVPVDNTTGTALLSAAAVWAALTSTLTTSGSIGERLKNAATVATTGDQIAASLNR